MDHFFEIPNFLISVVNKMLTAKSGVNAHYQNLVDIGKNIFQKFDRCMWVNRYTSLHFQCFYLLNVSVKMAARVKMNDQVISARLFEILCIPFRFFDHQMYIESLWKPF